MIRTIKILTIVFTLLSSQKQTKNFIKISGVIQNPISNAKLKIESNDIDSHYKKKLYDTVIDVDLNGVFSSIVKFPEGNYDVIYNNEIFSVELKPGYDLFIKFDSKTIIESIFYRGKGSIINQFNADKAKIFLNAEKKFIQNNIKNIDSFVQNEIIYNHDKLIVDYKEKISDSILDKKRKKLHLMFNNKRFLNLYTKKLISSKSNKTMLEKRAPDFRYENIFGKKISLSNYKGKYIFISLWATWCGPCKVQFPYLKKIQSKFEGENIVFLNISIDEASDKTKWMNYVKKEELPGIQLFENEGGNSDFISSLNNNSLPKYIIINPDQELINLNAPKPSSTEKLILFIRSLLFK